MTMMMMTGFDPTTIMTVDDDDDVDNDDDALMFSKESFPSIHVSSE
jgi:hypothetical protein